MKKQKKEAVKQHIEILFKEAVTNSHTNPKLAQKQAHVIRKLSMKFKIKMPWQIRTSFCKKCKKFIVPNVSSRIRIGRSNTKSIRITCSFCSHTYRKIISK